MFVFFFFKQKTAYEMRISDWSSDVCSSDLYTMGEYTTRDRTMPAPDISAFTHSHQFNHVDAKRSEEHTSELPSLMRISYAVFCLKKKNKNTTQTHQINNN